MSSIVVGRSDHLFRCKMSNQCGNLNRVVRPIQYYPRDANDYCYAFDAFGDTSCSPNLCVSEKNPATPTTPVSETFPIPDEDFETIFTKVQDDMEKAKLVVDSTIALCSKQRQKLDFVGHFKSIELQIKFINLMSQNAFNFYMETYGNKLTKDSIDLLDKVKLQDWIDNSADKSMFVEVKFYDLLDKLISMGIIQGSYMLQVFLANTKMYPVKDDAYNRAQLLKMFTNLLMWSDNVDASDFETCAADIMFVFCKYLQNKNKMLDVANQTVAQQSSNNEKID
jgi:hypothetical protein